MKTKNKIILGLLIAIPIIVSWVILLPTKIIAVHSKGGFSSVLIKHPPFTDKSKIDWWLRHKESLQRNFGIPDPASDGFFSVTFWDFEDGYKEEEKYDRLCFDDMKTQKKCIDKNIVFTVTNDNKGRLHINIYDGDNYIINKNDTFEIYHSNIITNFK